MKNMFFKVGLFVFCLSLAIGCGKKKKENEKTESARYDFSSEKTLQEIVSQYMLTSLTKDSMNGESYYETRVGGIVGTRKKDDFFKCSAFLIGSDLAVTNAHCINTYGNCSENLYFIFNDQNGEKITSRCKKIIEKGDPNDLQNSKDFALVQIDHQFPKWFDLNFSKTEDLSEIIFRVVTPTNEGGTISTLICYDIHNTMFSHYEALGTKFAVGCPVIPGNSGSPVIQNGQVIGLTHAIIDSKIIDDAISFSIDRYVLNGAFYSTFNDYFSTQNEFKISMSQGQKDHQKIDIYYDFIGWDLTQILKKKENSFYNKVEETMYENGFHNTVLLNDLIKYELNIFTAEEENDSLGFIESVINLYFTFIPSCLSEKGIQEILNSESKSIEADTIIGEVIVRKITKLWMRNFSDAKINPERSKMTIKIREDKEKKKNYLVTSILTEDKKQTLTFERELKRCEAP